MGNRRFYFIYAINGTVVYEIENPFTIDFYSFFNACILFIFTKNVFKMLTF